MKFRKNVLAAALTLSSVAAVASVGDDGVMFGVEQPKTAGIAISAKNVDPNNVFLNEPTDSFIDICKIFPSVCATPRGGNGSGNEPPTTTRGGNGSGNEPPDGK